MRNDKWPINVINQNKEHARDVHAMSVTTMSIKREPLVLTNRFFHWPSLSQPFSFLPNDRRSYLKKKKKKENNIEFLATTTILRIERKYQFGDATASIR